MLKPCPFCGGDGALKTESIVVGFGDSDRLSFVECKECGARTKGFGRLEADKEDWQKALAVLFWERRAEE